MLMGFGVNPYRQPNCAEFISNILKHELKASPMSDTFPS